MSRHLFACAIGSVMALTVSVAAQNPPSQEPTTQPPSTQRPATPPAAEPAAPAAQAAAVTVEGCLVREQDVPGRKPNVAERAGVMEDYILTDTKIVKGTAPSASAAEPKAGEPTGTSGSSQMFDVKGIDGDRLKEFAGKRVQIDGKFEDLDKNSGAKATEDLVNIQGTAIRIASGDCPAK